MAIFRILSNNKAYLVKSIPREFEDKFISENSKWFIKVDQYPSSLYNCYIYNPETNQIEIDIDCELEKYKQEKIKEIDNYAKKYLENIFSKEFNINKPYDEAISELQNSAINLETKILFFLKQKGINVTLSEIREKISLYLAGLYTYDDLVNELKELGLTDEDISSLSDLFISAAQVAKAMYISGEIQNKVKEYNSQIINASSIEEINSIISSINFE